MLTSQILARIQKNSELTHLMSTKHYKTLMLRVQLEFPYACVHS